MEKSVFLTLYQNVFLSVSLPVFLTFFLTVFLLRGVEREARVVRGSWRRRLTSFRCTAWMMSE